MGGNPWAAVIGGIIGGIGSAINIRRNNKKLVKAYYYQSQKMIKEYNYNISALDSQQQSAYDATKVDLFNLSLVGSKNIAMVRTALNESGLEGRSHAQVERETSGILGMQKASTQENYADFAKDLKVKRNNLYIQTNEALESAYKTMKEQQTGVWDAIFFKIPQGVAQGMSLAQGMSSDDSTVYGTEGRNSILNTYASTKTMDLNSYNSSGYSGLGSYGFKFNTSGGSGTQSYQFSRW